jgi:putative SOS response-associated peptidase YedK
VFLTAVLSAILAPADCSTWLDYGLPLKEVPALLKPYPAELMAVSEANARVNSPNNEGPRLLHPAA